MEKIFWIDLEMTGLDAVENVIIEFAGIVTDGQLKEQGQFHSVVYQPQEELDKMDEWNRKTHGGSGLLAKIPQGKPLPEVEREVLDFLADHFSSGEAIIAGNSIHQDRKFIDRYMPDLADFIHYRMLDVSCFKLVFKNMYDVHFEKGNSHRALDDIYESIAELKHYLGYINVPEKQTDA